MLSVQNLQVRLGAREVLRDVSLQVETGQICCVIGPNGSGKSTLLRAICGLVPMESGEVKWNGAPLPREARERARVVSLLPQLFAGGDDLSVEEMAMLGRTPHLPPYGAPSQAEREIVEAVLNRIAPDLRGRRVGELSGGEKQRVAMARSLATQSPIWLLDEPISALDLRFQHEILGLVRAQTRERNLVTICVLHGVNLAALIADQMLLLDENGTVVACGAPEFVMTRANLERVYRVPLRVAPHPLSGRPQAGTLWEFSE